MKGGGLGVGSVSRVKSGKYRARYRDPDGRQRAKHFEKKADAWRWLTTVEASKLDGSFVDPAAGRQTFGSFAEKWLGRQVHRPSTQAQVRSHLKNHILPAFGKRPLLSVKPSDVQSFVRTLSESLAPSTVETVYRHLASILLAAVDDRVLARSPCRGIKLPKKSKKMVHPIPSETVLALADAVSPRYRALVLCTAGTGLRQGETFGLTLEHVHLLQRELRVEQQLVQVSGEPAFGPPKTESSRRRIPIPPVIAEALAAHIAEFGVGEHNLVFSDEKGRPLRRNRFSAQVWRRAVVDVGAPTGTVFHDLRHFYASLLIEAGESVKTVQSRLGHASAVETLDTYGHLWPDSEDRTRKVVEEAFASGSLEVVEDHLRTGSIA